jgi:ABC-type glutathione transport system ATPase component
MQNTSCSIRVEHLRKVYGSVTAIDDLSFEVAAGEIFSMVDPNGAGKTTAVECLEGLRSPSGWTRARTNMRCSPASACNSNSRRCLPASKSGKRWISSLPCILVQSIGANYSSAWA